VLPAESERGHEMAKKKNKKTKAVRMSVVVQRINRKLAAKGQILLVASRHKMKITHHFGNYYILDLNGNVMDTHTDPEELARKLGVLKEGEKVISA
jgi:hypothetical protein